MKKNLLRSTLFLFSVSLSFLPSFSQNIVWQKALGGSYTESGASITAHAQGGYILTGNAGSLDGDVAGIHSPAPPLLPTDAWVVKLDDAGNFEWQKCLGGSSFDEGYGIVNYGDGTSLMIGYTASSDGDVSGYHGGGDAWLVKLDTSGTILWQKCLGGTSHDKLLPIKATPGGGAVLAGYSSSNDVDVSGNHGGNDVWVVKVDASGSIEWQKCLGGTGEDYGQAIHTTPDGGYIVTGISDSANGDVTSNHGGQDMWVVKLSATGVLEWQKSLGGTATDEGTGIIPAGDGGYLALGNTASNDGDVSGNHGIADAWVVKLDSAGNMEWQQCYGSTLADRGYNIKSTIDGGFCFTGYASDGVGHHGLVDMWLVKATPTGAIHWQVYLGGSGSDGGASVLALSDGSTVIAGTAASTDGDVTGLHGVDSDVWVVKLDNTWVGITDPQVLSEVQLFPNPVQGAELHLRFTLEQTTAPEIEISDVAGKVLQRMSLAALPAGNHETTVEIQSLPAGIYFLQLKAGGSTQTLKWVKAEGRD